jgi:hypothetical protein
MEENKSNRKYTYSCKWLTSCKEINNLHEGIDGHDYKLHSFHINLGEGERGDNKVDLMLR